MKPATSALQSTFKACRSLGVAAMIFSRGTALAQDSVAEPARPSDSLVDRLGVATHWGFRNSIYGTKYDELQRLLGDLGVRNVRDAYDPRLEELWKRYGVRAMLVTEP